MKNLLIKPLQETGKILDISPKTVGWNYVGFKVYKLKAGEKVFENTASDEAIIVFLEGYGAAGTNNEEFGKLGTRHSVFEKKPPSGLYVPFNSSWEVRAET